MKFKQKLVAAILAVMMLMGHISILENAVIAVGADLANQSGETNHANVEFDAYFEREISKGYIYANYAKTEKQENGQDIEAKNETEYSVIYNAQVIDKELVDSLEFIGKPEKYIDKDEEEHSSKVYTKSIKILDSVFNKILGEEGKLEIANKQGEKLAEITKDTEKDKENYYAVNISEAKTNEITIKTSKPQTEGSLHIVLEKAILVEQEYSKTEMESFEKLVAEVNVKAYTTEVETITEDDVNNEEENNKKQEKQVTILDVNKKIETKLIEPVSKAEISVNAESLSTVVENKDIEIKVVLDTLNTKNALYKNPVLQVVMPKNIETLKVNSVNLLLDDELKIAKKEIVEIEGRKAIQITLEGTQTKYLQVDTSNEQQNIIAKGANIVIKADVTFKKFTPSEKSNILLYYTNENTNLFENIKQVNNTTARKLKAVAKASAQNTATGETSTGISIVSPNGVVTENHISGYKDSEKIENITDEKQEAIIDTYTSKKEVTIGGIIVNNYENVIENIAILGRVPSEGNKQIDSTDELGSNFTIPMKEKITVSGIDSSRVKVFYSNNAAANRSLLDTANGWTETPTKLEDVRSYLIAITGEVPSGTQIDFNYKAQLPENLQFGKNTYTTYKVYFDNKTENVTTGDQKIAGVIGLTTGQGPDLNVELSTKATTVREGQIVKMDVKVKNNGTMTATNVKVNVPKPQKATFMEWLYGVGFQKMQDNSITIDIGTLKGGEEKQSSYYIQIDEDLLDDIKVSEGTIQIVDDENEIPTLTYPVAIVQKATLSATELKNTISSNEFKINATKGEIALNMYTERGDIYEVLHKGDTIIGKLIVTNISGQGDLNNVVVNVILPQGIIYKNAEMTGLGETTGTIEGISYNSGTRTITFNINKLKILKELTFNLQVQDITDKTEIYANAKADGIEENYSNILEFETEKVNLEVSDLSATPRYINESQNVTYTFTIKNKGNGFADNIQIIDVLPEDLEFEKAIYTIDQEETLTTVSDENNVEITINTLAPGKTAKVTIVAKAKLLSNENSKEIKNNIKIKANGFDEVTTNTVTNVVEYYKKIRDEINDVKPSNEDTPTPVTPDNPEVISTERYKITGTAWLDENKDGQKQETELPLSGIQVMLIYKQTSKVVEDETTGEQKIVITDENGQYEFTNLKPDEYLVVFLHDASKYSITNYQKQDVSENYNSDATSMKIVLDGEQRFAGVTDTIKITDSNARDIDIGLFVSEKFDLRLDKYISKVTLTTPTGGTKVYNYNNSKLIKREVYSKDVNNSTVIVEYKIVITNEGQVAGYAKKLIDYLPEDMKFITDLNKDWYVSNNNGAVYNTSLENVKINPGESKEVTLILSMNITDKTIGKIINNNAEIYESYNEQGLQDMDSIVANRLETEDDMSNADIIISMATGTIVLYTTLAFAVVMLLGIGIFEIKKRVLNKR